LRLDELAEKLGGRPVEGDASHRVDGVATLAEGSETALGFVRGSEWAEALERSGIGAVIAPPDLPVGDRPVIRSPLPSLDFARATALLVPEPTPTPGVHPSAWVAESARVHPQASVGPRCVVGERCEIGPGSVLAASVTLTEDVRVGADCRLHAGVVVRERSRLGDRVVLQPGVVIGGDGFGYEFNERGESEKVPQVGDVVIEDEVEIGANSTVDRARIGSTRIGRGTKIDNLVMIAHNVVIGPHSLVVAQTGIAGGTSLGERVIAMAQSGFAGHLQVGDGVFVGARAGVIENVEAGSRVWGFPAQAERAWHRSVAWLARLPELGRRVRALEKRLGVDRRGGDGERGSGD
jgi:UDP-3-O-[3-hydroxymyristoyl] glucosamine N-acyltransferase